MSKQIAFNLNLTEEFIAASKEAVRGYYEIFNNIIQAGNFSTKKMIAANRKLHEDLGKLLEDKEKTEDEYYQLASLQFIIFLAMQPVLDINQYDLQMAILTGEPKVKVNET